MARGQDQSTPSAGAEAEGRSVGTRSWLILSECHWLTIIGELRSLWFIIILIIASDQNVIFVLHIFLCHNILRQSATWRITIELQKSSTNHFNPKIEAKTPWDKGTEVSHWFRRYFDSAKCRKTSKKMLKGGQPCEHRSCERRYLEEILNEYCFQDVEKKPENSLLSF